MQRRTLVVASAALAALLALTGGALAGKPPKGGDTTTKTPPPQRDFTEAPERYSQDEYYVVAFKDPPAASYMGGIPGLERTKPERGQKLDPSSKKVKKYVDHLTKVHNDFRGYLTTKGPKAEVVGELFLAGNALAVKRNGTKPSVLTQGPGVRVAAPSALYQPTMTVSTGLIGAPTFWSALGGRKNAGSGIKVGIIDTGIDETHPAFGCKDEIEHEVFASGTAFDPSQTIVFDHGTHVAGTAAGCVLSSVTSGGAAIAGTWSGVAPGATLKDYNVFPGFGAGFVAFGGSAFSHDICAALEQAVADGMDVVNMSLGGGVQGPHDLLAECTNATADANVVPAVAAGNSGPGDSTVESPGNAAGALTAGASTNPHFVGIPVTVGTSTFGAALGDFNNFGTVTAAYTVTSPADGCTTIGNLSGKIALIDRGVCTFTTKIRNAQDAGAIGVLVVNNAAGDPTAMAHDGTDPFPTIPAAMLGKNEGNSIKPSGTATVDGTSPKEFITENADIIAGFSSRGPTPFTFLIKPDATAPGVNVLSSVFNGEFAFFQGTSMATPHLAGSAALILDANAGWSPADVKSAIVNTAARVVTDHIDAAVDPGVLARGGGRVDLTASKGTPLTLDPASVSFGFWGGNKTVSSSVDVRVRNVSSTSQLCGVSTTGPSIVSASPSSFSLASGATTTVTVSISGGNSSTTPSGDYTGDVVVTCGSKTLKAPWWTRIDREAKP
ncbi:MAG TPA: S8 family serine peptidase [Acidimicrobiia bacterium]|nr:S8 family serine peptidase [Acidimicrobiia bacterium]